MKAPILGLLLSSSMAVPAIADTPKVTLKGFLDTYYGESFNNHASDRRPPFLYNHIRTGEAAVNLALIQADLDGGWYRGSLGLMAGTYSQENLAIEPNALQHIFEAYAGVALNQKRTLWFDLGVFSSHIGFEGAISADNPTLSRSLMAENSPYYLAGGRLTWKPDEQWELAAFILNGWQRIQPLEGNSLPGFGTKVAWKPHDRLTLNWSTYAGSEFPDEQRRLRYFNNLFAQVLLTSNVSLFLGFDIGWQERATVGHDTWWSPNMIVRWKLDDRWATAFRVEHFNDGAGAIVGLPGGTSLTGFSLNLDREIHKNILFRIEARHLSNRTPAFQDGGSLVRNDTSVLTSISFRFQ